jgi:hypothetical protein
MKIKYAIHSSDSNPLYLDFWPMVSRVWKEKFGVCPVLIYIDKNHNIPIDNTHGLVIKMNPVKDIPVYLQCLWVRYWYPSQFPDDVSIICDIDMFPISKRYFLENIQAIPDDKYLHLNPPFMGTALLGLNTHTQIPTLPSCYHVARGGTFKKVLALDKRWEDSIQTVWNQPGGYAHNIGKLKTEKWGVDEEYATALINKYEDKSIFVLIPRTHKRIDRGNWVYTEEEIASDMYADSHSARPYSVFKTAVDELVTSIMRV